ncbi:unnamed protein product [Acanthoscelides obtectus]|uniref:Uncharacterized protein n=1 Tax=Acanthoscelides obtectus TaxID=200917 RepID=A0A9P0M0H6_ACAOB|nr:unnamed protein product [Acanthoscelides obtectus]CAK1621403.1 hypothetical protein AOBTE_LOCUS930 [Acanthoscelides obtectus]
MTQRTVFLMISVLCFLISFLSGAFGQNQLSPDVQQALQKLAQSVDGNVEIEVIEQTVPTRSNNHQNFYPTRQQYQPQPQYQYQQKPYRQMQPMNLNGYDAAIIIEETNQGPPKPNGNYYVLTDMHGRPINTGFPPNNNGRPNNFYPYPHHHQHNMGPPGPPPPGQFPNTRQPMDGFGPNWGPPRHDHGMHYDDYDYDYHNHGPRGNGRHNHGQTDGYTTENIILTPDSKPTPRPNNQRYTTENTNLSKESKEEDGSVIKFGDDDHQNSDENNISGYIGKFPVILLKENEIR